MRSPACRRTACACICAGAITTGRIIATCRSPTLSTSCSPRGPTAISFEAANPRHAHEWKLFETVKVPEGKVLIPGVIESKSNFIEHPELVAQRIERYARLVGRENVIAGGDCGLRHLGRPGRGRSRRGMGQAGGDGGRRPPRHQAVLEMIAAGLPVEASKQAKTGGCDKFSDPYHVKLRLSRKTSTFTRSRASSRTNGRAQNRQTRPVACGSLRTGRRSRCQRRAPWPA